MTLSNDATLVIDSDAHVIEPADLWTRYMPRNLAARIELIDGDAGRNYVVDGRLVGRSVGPGLPARPTVKDARYLRAAEQDWSAASQLEAMDREGIDLAALFPTWGLGMLGVDADSGLVGAIASAYNTWLSEFCAEAPNRLAGVGILDLRDPTVATEEAERCVDELGFIGVMARPNPVHGRQLYDRAYDGLWDAIERLDVPLCLHEGGVVPIPQVGTDRFDRHALAHCCSHPMEQQIAMTAVVLGGVLERHPRLRVGFMECGAGWLPYWMWRMDEHLEMDGTRDCPDLTMSASEYVRRQCFVSIDSDEWPGVATVHELDGRNVVWGSDYPHPDSKFPDASSSLSELAGLSHGDVTRILHDNAIDLYGPRLGELARLTTPLRR